MAVMTSEEGPPDLAPALEPPEPEIPSAAEAETDAEAGLISFQRSHFYMVLLPVAFVTGLAVGYLAWGRGQSDVAMAQTQPPPVAAATQTTRMEVSVDDDPSLGPEDAPITIVEFSDFNCPYCQRFHHDTFQPLLENYGDKIHFVYRDFPVTSQESYRAAQAAQCANEQGEFWPYHDALFTGALELGPAAYRQYAEELGLDSEALMQCVEEERYAEEVQEDARYASGLGVSGTPTFFINGIPLVGAQPLNRFTQVIDGELR
jgi:protein-disulfide isomerase